MFFIGELFVIGNAVAVLSKNKLSMQTRKQCMCVLAYFWMLAVSYILFCRGGMFNTPALVISVLHAIALTVIMTMAVKKDKSLVSPDKRRVKVFGIIIAAFVLLSIPEIGNYPLWDAAFYTESINEIAYKFDYGLKTLVSDYYMCGHISLGYTMILLIGVFLKRGSVGVLLMQAIVGAVSGCAFYECLKVLKNKSENNRSNDIMIYLLTGMYMCSPAVMGMVGDLTLDYGMMAFLPIVMLCYLKKWRYLEVLMGIAFCMTKEPAVMIYGGFTLGFVIFDVIKKKQIDIKYILFRAIPGLVWIVVFKVLGAWGGDIKFTGETHSFGIDTNYINLKLMQYVYLNFSWLLLIVIAVLIILCIVMKKKLLLCDVELLVSLSLGFVFFIAFSILFITATHYRYDMILTYWYVMIISILILRLTEAGAMKVFVLLMDGVLLLQAFGNYDFVCRSKFKGIDLGNEIQLTANRSTELDDTIVYNRTYNNYVGLIEKIIIASEITPNTIIAVPSGYGTYSLSGYPAHGFYIDGDTGGFSRDPVTAVDHLITWWSRIALFEEIDQMATDQTDKIVCIDFAWRDDLHDEVMNLVGDAEPIEVSEGNWKATVYVLDYKH